MTHLFSHSYTDPWPRSARASLQLARLHIIGIQHRSHPPVVCPAVPSFARLRSNQGPFNPILYPSPTHPSSHPPSDPLPRTHHPCAASGWGGRRTRTSIWWRCWTPSTRPASRGCSPSRPPSWRRPPSSTASSPARSAARCAALGMLWVLGWRRERSIEKGGGEGDGGRKKVMGGPTFRARPAPPSHHALGPLCCAGQVQPVRVREQHVRPLPGPQPGDHARQHRGARAGALHQGCVQIYFWMTLWVIEPLEYIPLS